MGWGSILGGIGSIAAAPFTGGTSLAWLPAALGAGGAVADAIGSGRAAGRQQEAGVNNQYDQTRLQAARMMEDALQGRAALDLKQRQFGLDAPGQRASNAVRGDALAGMQDAGVNGPIIHTHGQIPQLTGGLRPSLLSQNTRDLGTSMNRQALLGQQQGDSFNPLPPINVPQPTQLPQANGLDSLLHGIGAAGGLTSMFGQDSLWRKFGQPQQAGGPPSSGLDAWGNT